MENELKYLLPLHFNASALAGWTMTEIMQGYVDNAEVKIWRDADSKPWFSVRMESPDDLIYFETDKINDEQFSKLSSKASAFDGISYTLPKDVRIRNESGEYSLTYKQLVGGDLVEVEDEITKDLFERMQSFARDFVFKDRYFTVINDERWFVDFLRDYTTADIYCVLSEVEMPDGRQFPIHTPKVVKDNSLFDVPRDDNRFTNKKLANQSHAAYLYGLYTPSCL
jgi:hypothetical protein